MSHLNRWSYLCMRSGSERKITCTTFVAKIGFAPNWWFSPNIFSKASGNCSHGSAGVPNRLPDEGRATLMKNWNLWSFPHNFGGQTGVHRDGSC